MPGGNFFQRFTDMKNSDWFFRHEMDLETRADIKWNTGSGFVSLDFCNTKSYAGLFNSYSVGQLIER